MVQFRDWDKLLYGIERRQCILFVGPELPMVPAGGERRVPARLLAERLLGELDEGRDSGKIDPATFAQVAQRFLARDDEVGLEMQVQGWHESLRDGASTVHDQLAALPFELILLGSHDPLMEAALRRAGKEPTVARYHFRGANPTLLPEPSVDAPLLFHLYGHVDEPASLVLTETQLLDYLAAMLSKNPPLPNDVNAALTNGRLFLFVGFGLRQWYLRILLHTLKIFKRRGRAYAIETLDQTAAVPDEGTVVFYRDNCKLDIYREDAAAFVGALHGQWIERTGDQGAGAASSRTPAAATSAGPGSGAGPSVFLCHASEDAEHARRVHDALARSGLDPWLDKESLRGGDRWDGLIESTIKEVDYFVVFNSQALVAKTQAASYVNKEINVAKRAEDWRMGSFIIPILIDDATLISHLAPYHAIDLRHPNGMRDLVRAIKRRLEAA